MKMDKYSILQHFRNRENKRNGTNDTKHAVFY